MLIVGMCWLLKQAAHACDYKRGKDGPDMQCVWKTGAMGGAASHRLPSLSSDFMNIAVPWRTMNSCYSSSYCVCVCVRLRDTESMWIQSFSRLWQTSERPPWIIIAFHYFRFNLMISNSIPAAQTCLKCNSHSVKLSAGTATPHTALCAWVCLCGTGG